MTVQPYTSPSDSDPFNPNTPSDPNAQGSGGGGDNSIPSSAQEVPDLAMYWHTPPDLTPQTSGGSSSGSGSTVAPVDDLSVDLGGLRDSEQTMLTAASAIVDAYEALKSQFLSVKDTVFGQKASTTTIENAGSGDGVTEWVSDTSPDPIQSAAQQFANGSNGQPGMNAIQANALQQIGDGMAVIGEFIALLNAAAQQYAQADASSFLPPPS